MRSEITYFLKSGEDNTAEVLRIAYDRYKKGDLDVVVIASSLGKTAKKAVEVFQDTGAKLLFVGEVLDGKQSPSTDICAELEEKGYSVIWGLPMGQISKFTRNENAKLVADAYKRISEGFKVVCEMILMAANAGYLKSGAKVLSIAGTHSGADTAIVAYAAGYEDFKKFQVLEILCKPYERSVGNV
jgi:hypothetical protein